MADYTRIETEEDLIADVEENPFPYLMLISASRYPFTIHGEDEILQLIAEHRLEVFDSGGLKKDFKLVCPRRLPNQVCILG
jgi:hypothetical protein